MKYILYDKSDDDVRICDTKEEAEKEAREWYDEGNALKDNVRIYEVSKEFQFKDTKVSLVEVEL